MPGVTSLYVKYDVPANLTFYLTAITRGAIVAYMPFHVNVYDCG